MNINIQDEILKATTTSFIDYTNESNLALQPRFVSNNYKEGKKVISALEEQLKKCDEFIISVAFITDGGLKPLLQILEELNKKGVKGKVLTTNYKIFTSPKALATLATLKNIEVKMLYVQEGQSGFHTKGYIFKNDKNYKVIVGSSNLTLSALTRNQEWNIEFTSMPRGKVLLDIVNEFEQLWKQADPLKKWFDTYKKIYEEQRELLRKEKVISVEQYSLCPNSMQVSFISNLIELQQKGETRALLISATGTGKTYASAFALREMSPKKALFIVHREQIAKQAMKSYKNVFGRTTKMGLLSGNSKEYEADYLFATMQMLAKPEIQQRFNRKEFDVIVIDEVHRSGSESYGRIIEYFEPKFWLGMTASPDRTDNFDIYKLFNHNIAYEIRLQQALEEDLLCPFHYFGITDLQIDGKTFNDKTGMNNFNQLISDNRVDYVIEKAKYYGYSGERVKGLVFCSSIKEAEDLSNQFNSRNYRTVALVGNSSSSVREKYIEQLATDSGENQLDYIFTVDVFNEGVDIPEVNQVIMLRPTQSPTVFIQQLGRGLRKAEGKEYVVILDFIGNYTNNFMIPIALSGDRTYNKDTIRRCVIEGNRVIPGSSTIHFDEIARKQIFESINKVTTPKRFLEEKYMILKNKLGKIPNILDFYNHGEIDPMLFINYAKTYDRFVRMVDHNYKIKFNKTEADILEFVSSFLINGKRPHELLLLQMLLTKEHISLDKFKEKLAEIEEKFDEATYKSAYAVLNKEFMNTPIEKTRFSTVNLIEKNQKILGNVKRAFAFHERLKENKFREELITLIKYGLKRYHDLFKNHDENQLVLYQKYSRKDVCRLLNWERDESSTIYGYRIKYNTCPIFVTYEKNEDISNSTKYADEFINNKRFSWMTRSRVTLESREAQELINYQDRRIKVLLFIKKSDSEGSDFYYMGNVRPVLWEEVTIQNDKGQTLPIVNFQLELDRSIREDIYDYFIG